MKRVWAEIISVTYFGKREEGFKIMKKKVDNSKVTVQMTGKG